MVFNQTKVVHARLLFRKPSGSIIEIFCLAPHHQYADIQTAMLQKKQVLWECMIGGASKWKHGLVLELQVPEFKLTARITARTEASYIISLEWDNDQLTFSEVLQQAGKMPLPPYLHREAEYADEERYQTIFGKEEGSVAAPTAGLHFTDQVLDSLSNKNIEKTFVTLHVGAGTFKPVKSETMQDHTMHEEWIDVSKKTIEQLIKCSEKDIIAVGTTSLRTLESLYWIGNKLAQGLKFDLHGIAVRQWEPYETESAMTFTESLQAIAVYMQQNNLVRLITKTQILIAPGYKFRTANGLVTNFHQPHSTLLLLVAAFIGEDWRKVYDYALNNNFRFLSYGDGCLLWRNI
jgi:S-adenosylmethionine:tRNA ribosyltransferase-isomerase